MPERTEWEQLSRDHKVSESVAEIRRHVHVFADGCSRVFSAPGTHPLKLLLEVWALVFCLRCQTCPPQER